MIAFPHSTSCAWNGLGTSFDAWLNGAMNTQTATHELGHTLGFGHSKSMSCTAGGARVAISPDPSSCSVDEYGDPFDVMGSGTGRHVNNVAKSGLGWLGGGRVQDVTLSGSYNLAPAELPLTDLPQLLRVRRADGSTLNLEFRRPFGQFFDNFASDEPVVNGVTVRWTPAGTRSTYILDANPATAGFDDAPLAPGQTFEDSAGGISITTTRVSDGSATIAILVATNQPDTQAPGAPVDLLATPSSDNTAALSWAAAIDNVAVASYRVSRDGVMIATLPASSIGYADGGLLPAATYRYAVTAVDAAGNAGPAAETTLTMPSPPMRDTVAPAAPPNLTAATGKARKIMLAWGASSDDVGVAGYRVYRNGAPVATVSGTSFTDSAGGKATTTTYAVVAYDAAGNVSPSSNIASVR